MPFTKYYTAVIIFLSLITLSAQNKSKNDIIIGSAFSSNHSHDVLRRICDEAGGRMIGTKGNEKAIAILKEELKGYGIESRSEKFKVPGWFRGEDKVNIISPCERKIEAKALGYVDKTNSFSAEVIYSKYGFAEDYSGGRAEGKIVLVTQDAPQGKDQLLRYEAIDTAAKYGAKAILFMNNKSGFILMDGTSNFEGKPSKIPAFTISFEEGAWIRRLLDDQKIVKIEIAVNSYCAEAESENVVVSFPGKVKEKILVGAHFDAWDLGQGGIDNGLGTAILFETARLLKQYSAENYYSIDLVWFNGEELGLWGAKKYAEAHKDDNIKAMLNMDMDGAPTGFNVMGSEELRPFFESMVKALGGFDLSKGVVSFPYTNSDHVPFMLKGIPVFCLQAHLDDDMIKYYHDAGDTFDKVDKKYLSEASAVVSVVISELANNSELKIKNKTETETISVLKKYGLDKRLKRQHEWIFGVE